MSDYAFKIDAQQWDRDPYYVASRYPVHHVEVVASTKQAAIDAAREVLGDPDSGRYWRYWVRSMKDIRIVAAEAAAAAGSE